MAWYAFRTYERPNTFQRTMDMTFNDMRDITAVYMDHIVVFSSTWLEHLANIKAVLTRLRENKLFVKRSKREFASEEIDFVGFRIIASGGGGYELNPKR